MQSGIRQRHRYRHLFQAGLAGACCAALLTFPAGAVTTNTVRGYYGLQNVQDVAPLQEELDHVQRTIRTTEEIEFYNSIVADLPVEQLDMEISSRALSASSLRTSLLSGIDMPFEDMLAKEVAYTRTVNDLNDMLAAREAFSAVPVIDTPDEDLDTLYGRESELEAAIKKAGAFDDIGEADFYPVSGYDFHLNSRFGPRWDPVGVRGYSYHYGADLYAPYGTDIRAWFSGVVYKAGFDSGSGNYIWIDHGNGVRSFYCHLSRIDVTAGQQVKQGDHIALSGNTGKWTTGPHLHLGLYIDGTAVDPCVALGK